VALFIAEVAVKFENLMAVGLLILCYEIPDTTSLPMSFPIVLLAFNFVLKLVKKASF